MIKTIRVTTIYDQRPDGWRKLRVEEKPVESTHSCVRCKPPYREPRKP